LAWKPLFVSHLQKCYQMVTLSCGFLQLRLPPNDRGQARRAEGARIETESQSRRRLHYVR